MPHRLTSWTLILLLLLLPPSTQTSALSTLSPGPCRSQWLDADRVICGTKDNQLVVWNVTTGRHCELICAILGLKVEGIKGRG